MATLIISSVCVVLGAILMVVGIFLGVKPSANYAVEGAFAMFAMAGVVFVVSVVAGLAKEFRETA